MILLYIGFVYLIVALVFLNTLSENHTILIGYQEVKPIERFSRLFYKGVTVKDYSHESSVYQTENEYNEASVSVSSISESISSISSSNKIYSFDYYLNEGDIVEYNLLLYKREDYVGNVYAHFYISTHENFFNFLPFFHDVVETLQSNETVRGTFEVTKSSTYFFIVSAVYQGSLVANDITVYLDLDIKMKTYNLETTDLICNAGWTECDIDFGYRYIYLQGPQYNITNSSYTKDATYEVTYYGNVNWFMAIGVVMLPVWIIMIKIGVTSCFRYYPCTDR